MSRLLIEYTIRTWVVGIALITIHNTLVIGQFKCSYKRVDFDEGI